MAEDLAADLRESRQTRMLGEHESDIANLRHAIGRLQTKVTRLERERESSASTTTLASVPRQPISTAKVDTVQGFPLPEFLLAAAVLGLGFIWGYLTGWHTRSQIG